MAEIEDIQDQIAALESALDGTSAVVSAFDGELARMRESLVFTGREVNTLSTGIGGGLRKAFDGLVFDGMRASDALRTVASSMVDTVYNIALRPIQNAFGGALAHGVNGLLSGMMPFAQGGVFQGGRVTAFAKGGIVGGPTAFTMGDGMGLMGEAGPEAIMPLTRGPDGSLGIRSHGGGRPVTVVMNINTPDVQGFQRSQSQIAAQAARMLSRGQKNR